MSFLNNDAAPVNFPAGEHMDDGRATIMIQAKMEVKATSMLLTKLQTECVERCVSPNHSTETLVLSEQTCLDRCTIKFLQTHNVIGESMVKQTMAMQENGMMPQ